MKVGGSDFVAQSVGAVALWSRDGRFLAAASRGMGVMRCCAGGLGR